MGETQSYAWLKILLLEATLCVRQPQINLHATVFYFAMTLTAGFKQNGVGPIDWLQGHESDKTFSSKTRYVLVRTCG